MFTSAHLHLCSSSHPHIYISHLHLSLFLIVSLEAGAAPPDRHETQPSAEIARVGWAKCRRECDLSRSRATLCADRARRVRAMQARVRFVPVAGNPLRRSCVSSARNAGESAICLCPSQPSAEIARRVREMQARVRFVPVAGNPLRRSCVSSERNAGESAICLCPSQPSAEIVRVECAKCRR